MNRLSSAASWTSSTSSESSYDGRTRGSTHAALHNAADRSAARHGASASEPLAAVQGLLKARACPPCPTCMVNQQGSLCTCFLVT